MVTMADEPENNQSVTLEIQNGVLTQDTKDD
jgi:hypothetical protein